ncbi:nascent polypeptide-associated complex protein [archaeon]|nr:nascent polypeptide-associated complex protein [archaeon]|tara:strand:+ start:1059 stop:1382 length:324 start_codon:yes stop_codon:yes gene_type:complete
MFQGMNPKLVKQAMKKMGVKETPIDASEVIIKTPEHDILIRNPQVSKVDMMGQQTFQITGEPEILETSNKEDIQTIIDQTNCTQEQATQALKKADGDLAKAIMDLQS